jgi:hypothetical protein
MRKKTMPATLLTTEIRDLLANLVTRHARPQEPWEPSIEENRLLIRTLEQVLADLPELRHYLRFLQSLLHSNPPSPDMLDDANEDQVLVNGLSVLDGPRLWRLAIDPVALLSLRDAICEQLSDYWWNILKQRGRETGRLKSHDEILHQFLSRARKDDLVGHESHLAGAFHDGGAASPNGPQRWTQQAEGVTVEFTLIVGPLCRLEVLLFGRLTLAPSDRCEATLFRDGQMVTTARPDDLGKLSFTLPSSDVSDLELAIDCRGGNQPECLRVIVKE